MEFCALVSYAYMFVSETPYPILPLTVGLNVGVASALLNHSQFELPDVSFTLTILDFVFDHLIFLIEIVYSKWLLKHENFRPQEKYNLY